jgi:hypothetical protein
MYLGTVKLGPKGISSVWAITWHMKPVTSVDIIRGHDIQAPHHRPACRPLWSRCLGEVYRNGTRWARQCKCLKRVVWRVVRGAQAQVSRRTRQERLSSARVRRARFYPDHDGPMCRPQLDPHLHDLGSRGECGPRPVDCRPGQVKAVSLTRTVVLTMAIDANNVVPKQR